MILGGFTRGVSPYVGAGVGVSFGRKTTGYYADSFDHAFTSGSASSTVGFGLVEGGLEIKLASRWTLVPAYRFTRSFQNESGHIGKLGLRYAF